MKKLLLSVVFVLGGCSATSPDVPSFYDSNESQMVMELVWDSRSIDCTSEIAFKVTANRLRSLDKFKLYVELNGSNDIVPLVEKVDKLSRFDYRKEVYCDVKKRILVAAADELAFAVFDRIKF